MNLADEDWVDKLSAAEAPEEIMLQALKENLYSDTLATFNDKLKEIASLDASRIVLRSTPLELVPVLLAANQSITDHPIDVRQTLELIALHGSAKEVLLVVQESLGSLVRSIRDQDNEDADEEPPPAASPAQVVWKWASLVEMYSLAFPRLVLRKRSAPETAGPIVEHLRKSFATLGILIDPNTSQGPEVVDSCIRLRNTLLRWFETIGVVPAEITKFKVSLQALLYTSVAECDLRRHLPGALFWLSRPKWRRVALRWLTERISTGLSVETDLNSDIATDIVPAISSVAATDPRPDTRAAAFRLLTQIVLKVHSEVAFGLVHQLVGEDCPFMNMRASAVSLLRQLVVRAFSKKPPAADDPFAARILLQEYAPILFRSYLLGGAATTSSEVPDPQEINRIVESLGFYYVLLARDTDNLTGVRDPKFQNETNAEFIAPLKQRLIAWGAESEDQQTQFAARTTEVSLERVEEMLANLEL
ncbi:hypothetical protein FRC07_005805 [Ceratobasidium sp. 392]|nr:hypothetical protein FRC07_005805 [Ceratobasidium sp. 392]